MIGPDIRIAALRNQLLTALPIEVFAKLWPHLRSVELPTGYGLVRSEQPISAVYFPETAYAVVLARTAGGVTTDIGMVGREGMVGLPLLLGASTGALDVVVQGPGTMLRLDAGNFGQALEHVSGLRQFLACYMLAFHERMAQSMACSFHCPCGRRLAQRLLDMHDHHVEGAFPAKPDFLALLPGMDLAEVAAMLWQFQRTGLVRHRQGRMTVLNRRGLEDMACGCHAMSGRRSSGSHWPNGAAIRTARDGKPDLTYPDHD